MDQLPLVALERDTNLSLYDFPSRIRDALLEVVLKAAIECAEMQSQSTFSCVQAALDWLADEEAVNIAIGSRPGEKESEDVMNGEECDTGNDGDWYMRGEEDCLYSSGEDERREAAMIEAATLAAASARSKYVTSGEVEADEGGEESSTSKRGTWRYVIGLVGKPSAGKSTFFNAATKACLHRGGRLEAAVASHPFTTIEPNVGPGFFLGPPSRSYLQQDQEHRLRRPIILVTERMNTLAGAFACRN